MYWWSGLHRYNRALLVITTECSQKTPATLQVWNTSRSAGTRIFRCSIEELDKIDSKEVMRAELGCNQIRFGRGIAQVGSGICGPALFCGGSNGSVYGIHLQAGREGGFKAMCAIRDLSHAVVVLAGDRRGSCYLAGADECGKLIVWKIEEETDKDGKDRQSYKRRIVYEYAVEEDMFCSLGVRGETVFAGHASGYVTVHNMEDKVLVASIVTNTKCVTGIDVYQDKDLVLVSGEDCRVTILGFSASRGHRPVVHFSVALDAIVVGCALLGSPKGYPRIVALTWERCKLVQYDYEKGVNREHKKRGLRREEGGCVLREWNAESGLGCSAEWVQRGSESSECCGSGSGNCFVISG